MVPQKQPREPRHRSIPLRPVTLIKLVRSKFQILIFKVLPVWQEDDHTMCECLVWSVSYFTHGVVDILCGQGPVWLLSVWWMLYIYIKSIQIIYFLKAQTEGFLKWWSALRASHGSSAEVKHAQRAAKSSKNSDQVRNWKMGKGGLPKSQQLSL